MWEVTGSIPVGESDFFFVPRSCQLNIPCLLFLSSSITCSCLLCRIFIQLSCTFGGIFAINVKIRKREISISFAGQWSFQIKPSLIARLNANEGLNCTCEIAIKFTFYSRRQQSSTLGWVLSAKTNRNQWCLQQTGEFRLK